MVAAPFLGGGLRAWHQRFVQQCRPSSPSSSSASISATSTVAAPTLLTLQTDLPASSSPGSIDSAISTLVCYGCVFSSTSISIARGYYAVVDDDADSVIELFLLRSKAKPRPVVQVSATAGINFLRSKLAVEHDGYTALHAGVIPIRNPGTSWFVLFEHPSF